ncbi:MAG: hypothetical protein ABJA57_06125 [Ginsengibacter sp.]
MEISKQEQFVHENKTWGRSLDFFKQENNLLKNRLSIIVDNKEDKEFLIVAEFFQSQFILKDQFIDDLKNDVKHHEKYIVENFNNVILLNTILKKQEKLRNEIGFFEKDFSSLRHQFNKSIAQFL